MTETIIAALTEQLGTAPLNSLPTESNIRKLHIEELIRARRAMTARWTTVRI